MFLGVHSRKSGQREIYNRQHSVSIAFPVNVAEATLAKQAEPLAMQFHEHRHNLRESLLEKSKLAQHACEEGHRVGWDEGRILDIESNSMYMKYKELAPVACLTNPISQPSVDFLPSGSPLLAMKLAAHREDQYDLTDSSWVSIRF
jgi:hypothetical protein